MKHLTYKNKKGLNYFLYSKVLYLKDNKLVRIYFFNKDQDLKTTDHPAYTPRKESALPLGYAIRETKLGAIPIIYLEEEPKLITEVIR